MENMKFIEWLRTKRCYYTHGCAILDPEFMREYNKGKIGKLPNMRLESAKSFSDQIPDFFGNLPKLPGTELTPNQMTESAPPSNVFTLSDWYNIHLAENAKKICTN